MNSLETIVTIAIALSLRDLHTSLCHDANDQHSQRESANLRDVLKTSLNVSQLGQTHPFPRTPGVISSRNMIHIVYAFAQPFPILIKSELMCVQNTATLTTHTLKLMLFICNTSIVHS